MDLQAVIEYAKNNPGIMVGVAIAVYVVGILLSSVLGFYVSYFAVLAAAALVSFATGNPLYFWPFLLGVLTAFAEIISKFPDEPIKALKSPHALLYHVLNGIVAAFALYILMITGFKNDTPGDQLKNVLLAGFGSMLVMRSKLFNIKVGEEDVSFGPEQVIKILFKFMNDGIDRFRASSRFDFVHVKLDNIDFDKVYAYSKSSLRAAQALEDKKEACVKRLNELKENKDELDTQLRSYELGYAMLTAMGEDFVTKLFLDKDKKIEWHIRAPHEDGSGSTSLGDKIKEKLNLADAPPDTTALYMAYGASMSSRRMRERLNWLDADGKERLEKLNPVRCVLKDYGLVFNKLSDAGSQDEECANLVYKQGESVEGVLYQLPKQAMDFLAHNENDYHRVEVSVTVEEKKKVETKDDKGKKVEMEETAEVVKQKVYVYLANATGPERVPDRKELDAMKEGAHEHELSGDYVERMNGYVEELKTKAAAAPETEQVPSGGNGVKVI